MKSRSTGSGTVHRIAGAIVSLLLMCTAFAPVASVHATERAASRGRVPMRVARLIRTTPAREFGVSHLTSLAATGGRLMIGSGHRLVIVRSSGRGSPAVLRVPGRGAVRALTASRGGRAFATRNGSSFAVDLRSGRVARRRAPGCDLGSRCPAVAVDGDGVTWAVDGTSIVRTWRGRSLGAIRLPFSPRALAYDPADALAYALRGRTMLGFDRDAHLVRIVSLRDLPIARIAGIAFAPTADPTDDAALTTLYIADAGSARTSEGQLVEASLAPAVAAATTVTATLVKTVDTSKLTPPSPDSSGIAWLPGTDLASGRFMLADSEVDEMPIFQNANLWLLDRSFAVGYTGDTTRFSHEPTGVAYNPSTRHLFTSDDDQLRIHEIVAGSDGKFGTADDTTTSISTSAFGNGDAEDAGFDTRRGQLLSVAGVGVEAFITDPGPNGRFDGTTPTGDDTTTHFDVAAFGAGDPEGIVYDAQRDTILVLDDPSQKVYELSRSGQLLNVIDITAARSVVAAGITLAPGTSDPSKINMFITDRGIDNNSVSTENDGRIYEMSFSLPNLGNQAPIVNAGPDVSVVETSAATLNGSVSDDALPTPPGTVTQGWTMVSGPGTVSFASDTSASTTATFSAQGAYVLRLTASDSLLTSSDDVTVTVTSKDGPFTLDRAVTTSSDDAEESSGGSVSLTSSDLELVYDGSNQTVGLRFTSVSVPKDATILSSSIQFETDEVSTGATSLTIQGQAADNPATFSSTSKNISSRLRTAASVTWASPDWPTVQIAGPAQRTPDLKTIVQELVRRSGWSGGNAMAFVISGTGKRTAEAFDGTRAPSLRITYSTGGAVVQNQPPTVNAGADTSVVLPATLTVTGSVQDDGLPNPPALVTQVWSKESGPTATSTATFNNANALSTTVTFSDPGTYVLRLTASDSVLSASDDITVTVSASVQNQPPTVNAGADTSVVLPATLTVTGSVQDDGLPNPPALVTQVWSKESGPTATSTATFNNANALSTTVTFSDPGTYVLRLTASDSVLSASDDITVTVLPSSGATSTVTRSVAAGSDDAEESSRGSVSLDSTDLELVVDSSAQKVGIRFTNLTIPRGAAIVSASIQFEVDEVTTGSCSLTIQGQAADDPGTFTTTSLNVSSRARTTQSVPWTPDPWGTKQVAGPAQRTPDLSTIVQTLVDRAGWASGHAMAFIITGSGKRTAEAFEGTKAPSLTITYVTP